MFINCLYVMIGGALGSLARYLIAISPFFSPIMATLFVNGLGSLLIGFFYSYAHHKALLTSPLSLLVAIGILGGFTTFSTFSLDMYKLLEQDAYLEILKNVTLTLVITLTAVCLGAYLGKIIIKG